MGDLATLVPSAGAFSGFVIVLILLLRQLGDTRRLLAEADQRYRDEVRDHEQTQGLLDAERTLRRELQDELGPMRFRLAHLEAEVRRLGGSL